MNLEEFKDQLLACQTPQQCAVLVRDNFDDISLIFYDAARADMAQTIGTQKQLFDAFMAGPVVRTVLQDRAACPPAVTGLLVLFGSFFERNAMYAELLDALQVMPAGSAKKHLESIFHYRRVSDAATGYGNVFSSILELLNSAAAESPASATCAEAILAEFFAIAVSTIRTTVGKPSADSFRAIFQSPGNLADFPILGNPDFRRALALSDADIARKSSRININAVESLYDTACLYVSPPAPPDPTADEGPVDGEVVHVQLPDYLDQLIFGAGGLGGVYEPDPNAVRDGMSADVPRQKIYLGTYFPRSFAESFSIFRPLLEHTSIRDALSQKQVLSILDIGAGTGGDLVGILHAIAASTLEPARIDIVSLEGNPTAIPYQERVVSECAAATGLNVKLSAQQMELPTTSDGFAAQLDSFLQTTTTSFDIAITWKALNEFYHRNYASAQGVYRAFLQSVAPYVSQRGLCLVLDTSNKVKNRNVYLPIILNREARAYVQSASPRLLHILPRSCAHWAHHCKNDDCYIQRIFYVSHSARTERVKSRVAYKAFAPETFAQQLNSDPPAGMYRCNTAKPTLACRNTVIVNVPAHTAATNGFILN